MAKKQPDWTAIKAEYLKGGISIPKLAEKHRVSEDALKKRIQRGCWHVDRQQVSSELAQEIPKVVKQTVLSEVEKAIRRHFELTERGLDKASNMLDGTSTFVDKQGEVHQIPAVDDPKALRDWMGAIKDGIHLQRQALGIPDPVKPKADQPAADEGQASIIVVPADSEDWRGLIDDEGNE